MSPESLIEDLDQLVSMPEVLLRVNQTMAQPNCSAARLAEIISLDTDLSARLLRLVNSSFYGLRSKVDTISRAVTIAGTDELHQLVLATSAVRTFTDIPEHLVNMDEFWRHAVTTGVIAQRLGQACSALHTERLFVAGMLHDLGRLALYVTLPEKSAEILTITGGDEWILAQTEAEVLGFSHMDVGAALMRHWQLPENLVSVAENHHNPLAENEAAMDVALVHIAQAIARGEMSGFSIEEMLWAIQPGAWEATGLTPQSVNPLVEEMLSQSLDVMQTILHPAERQRA